MDFEWDDEKAEINFKKHGVTFTEAALIWLDPNALEVQDLNLISEERWVRLGFSRLGRILIVIFTEKYENEIIRIISARKATRIECEQYVRSGV